VHQNNFVYKGYRLTAKVVRAAVSEGASAPSGPVFAATVWVAPVNGVQDPGHEYPVPYFADGGVVYSPREAVHAAVSHGREIVDSLTGTPPQG